jgi:phenylalanyl-tRNA synthetase beta chain
MKLPLSWLKSLFPHPIKTTEIFDILTQGGIEVDAVDSFIPPFSNVVTAKVIECEKHPNADKLQLTKVFDGKDTYQVVCGAANCRKDLIVAFAKPGAVLGIEDPFEIKERQVRGVLSMGMLCSLDELGLSKEEMPGIIEFEESMELGLDLKSYLEDTVFEISTTPNLGHTLSVLGIARELSAFTKLAVLQENIPTLSHASLPTFPCEILSKECHSYQARVIEQIDPSAKTPFLMQHRLRLAGFNTKNLIVDVLNYVMFERGIPMHAFDKSKLEGNLKVESLKQASNFIALNGKNYTLPQGLLMIQSGHKLCACAGVMGSQDTATDSLSTACVIEAAFFEPSAVRRTIKAIDLRTDSANRFEKGVDEGAIIKAVDYATSLIQTLSHGKLSAVFSYQTKLEEKHITLRVAKNNRLLGTSLSAQEISNMLINLEIKTKKLTDEALVLEIPSYRNDLVIEEDIIEEVGRLYGLNNLKGHLAYKATTAIDDPLYTFEKEAKTALFSLGLQEALTCDLLSPALEEDFRIAKHANFSAVHVLHPRSSDQSTLRTSLLSSIVPCVAKNIANKETQLSFFEIDKVHAKIDHSYIEDQQIAITLTGLKDPYYFDPKPEEYDFYDLKGMVENLLHTLRVHHVTFKQSHDPVFHPYQQMAIYIDETFIGIFGQVHPDKLLKYDIKQKVFFAELSLKELMQSRKPIYPAHLPPTLPSIERDSTFTLDEDASYCLIENEILKNPPLYFEHLELLSIYPMGNKKNVTIRIRYRSKEKSLESAQIDEIHQNLMQCVAKKLQLSL